MTEVDLWIVEARAMRKAGLHAEAARRYEQAAAAYAAVREQAHADHCLRHAAEIWLNAGDAVHAREAIGLVLKHYRKDNRYDLEMANALRIGALVEEAAGERKKAESFWVEARAIYHMEALPAGVAEADQRILAMAA